ncbi:DUF1972 domain-containing protein [Mobilicoccus massiliensis]|uniref:DUF1972 domain-containing protein n=1 Tax=Mobilicoccus massiliensis TaxID=1522310 RepID=UPI000694518C|nr:DUF1972 domain-containing protein [Mobilicoccus massiliensis]
MPLTLIRGRHRKRPTSSLRVALLGTRGVPARYGGFETAVEEVGRRLVEAGHDVTVYCRTGNSSQTPEPAEHLGMKLVHLPAVRKSSLETLSHTFFTALHLLFQRRYDAYVLCNAANSPVLPLLRLKGTPIAVHVDGLEWRRSKWGPVGQRYYRIAESLSVRWADALIADAFGIQCYYHDEFGAITDGIAYGAPILDPGSDKLAEFDLKPRRYHLVVARFEPENHVHLMIEGYLESGAEDPLVVVGSSPYSDTYVARLEALAARSDKVHLVGGVWDQALLDQLYANSLTYLHGHSVGGTNPSLLRAMGAGAHTIAYDVVFNREVAGPDADYVTDVAGVAKAVAAAEADRQRATAAGRALKRRAESLYQWDAVADDYARLCARLADGASQRGLYTGHRSPTSPWRRGRTPVIEVPETRAVGPRPSLSDVGSRTTSQPTNV